MKKIFSLFLLILSFRFLFSQNHESNLDMFQRIQNSMQEKPNMFVNLDNKNSFINNSQGWFFSLKGGYEYNNLFRLGLGFSFLYNNYHAKFIKNIKKSTQTIYLQYISLFSEYIFHRSDKYDLSIPISINLGNSYFREQKKIKKYGVVIFYEAQLNSMYYFFKYFGIGGGVGYRLCLLNNQKIDSRITAPIYTIKFKLKLSK